MLRSTSRHAVQSSNPPRVQRTRAFDDNVDDHDKRIIQIVLDSDPVLMAAWQWIKSHRRYHLDITRAGGFNRIVAPLGEVNIKFNISPAPTGARNDPKWVNTVSHELNLHLLPWVRVVMFHELNGDLGYSEMDDPRQLARTRTVLRPIGANVDQLVQNINADKQNKQTATWGGNHSDIMLWVRHLRNTVTIAGQQSNNGTKGRIVSYAIANMMMPIRLTGRVSDVVDRGPGAYRAFLAVAAELDGFAQYLADDERGTFRDNLAIVRRRMAEYETYARILRELPGDTFDSTLFEHALRKGRSMAESVFLYVDIKESMG